MLSHVFGLSLHTQTKPSLISKNKIYRAKVCKNKNHLIMKSE